MQKWIAAFFVVLIALGLGLAQAAPQQPKNKGQQEAPEESVFSDAVANVALNEVRNGLEAHSPARMLAAFDSAKMDGYRTFAEQVQAFFDRYESFRVRYRIAQTTTEGGRGVALVDFEMEQVPRGENAPPQRRSVQLRCEFERGAKGWKIVDLQPRGFFS